MYRLLIAASAAALLALPGAASAQSRTKAGVLACNVAPTVGFVVGSRQDIACVFTPNYGRRERYLGAINRVGVDLGATSGGRLVWAVFAQTSALPPRSIAGTYVGASGEASVGIGAGANVLIGGSYRSVSLQPVSVKGQAGVNVGVGVAGLTLR
jgi:uncharacterized protein DUF992